jgi:hypothetical protein
LGIGQYLPHAVPFLDRAIGSVAGFAVLYGIAAAYKSLRGHDGMRGQTQNTGRHWVLAGMDGIALCRFGGSDDRVGDGYNGPSCRKTNFCKYQISIGKPAGPFSMDYSDAQFGDLAMLR